MRQGEDQKLLAPELEGNRNSIEQIPGQGQGLIDQSIPQIFSQSDEVRQVGKPQTTDIFKKKTKKNVLIVVLLMMMTFCAVKILTGRTNGKQNADNLQLQTNGKITISSPSSIAEQSNQPELRLPKIVWLYTDNPFNAEKMLEQVMGSYLIHIVEKSGWEIKIVNSWTAFEMLSQSTQNKITKTMQNMQIEEKVHVLYKLGLLLDIGGIVISPTQTLPIQTFEWVQQFFISTKQQFQSRKRNDILLFQTKTNLKSQMMVQSLFIAATKESLLVKDAFNEICSMIATGKITFPLVQAAASVNKQMNSVVVKDILKNTLHSYISYFGPQHYNAKVLSIPPENNWCINLKTRYMKRSKKQYKDICGQSQYFIYLPKDAYRTTLENEMEKLIDEEKLQVHKDSYWADLMNIPYNTELYKPLEPRPVHYCILDTHPSSDFQSIKQSVSELKKQIYSNWTAVYYLNKTQSIHVEYTKAQKKKGFDIVVAQHTESIGRNIQYGVIKLCPNKSFILIMKTHERLSKSDSLQNLVKTIQPRDVLGAYVSLNISGSISINPYEMQNYNKFQFNGKEPRIPDLERVKNHLRVFHSDCYKIIPQFELVTPRGEYYEDRFIFYENFMRMVIRNRQRTDATEIPHTHRTKWFIKSSRHVFDVPFWIKFHNDEPLINTDALEPINTTQLQITRFKDNAYTMMESMDHLMQNGQTMEDFAVFNPGNKFEGYVDRKKRNLPQRIPKIIHQIWVGDTPMNEGKKAIRDMNIQLYPDFEHKLWTSKDITRQNFPLSYDLILTLMKVNNFTRYSRMATVADVMRHEILYNEGGFYMDTGIYLFNKVFYDWLSYKVVIPTLQPFRHRWIQSMCLFANQPKYPGLLKIISHYNTNRYNIYLRDAMQIAGPYDFRQYIQGYDQYDPDILTMGFEYFFPMDYSLNDIFFETKCAIKQQLLGKDDEPVLKFKERVIIKNCGKYYPGLYGKQCSAIGGSTWQWPKWS